jgi:hypothetical protein
MIGDPIGSRAVRLAVLSGVMMTLAGCGGGNLLSGVYGSAATEPVGPMTSKGVPIETASAPIRIDFDPAKECPSINVPAGTSAYAAYAGQASPDNVRFQARISDFARECTLAGGNSVSIKVGVKGLVILGEKGSPGTYPAPLRIAVRDRDGTVVASNSQHLSVTIPAGSSQGSFKVVDNSIIVPIGLEKPLGSYEILVGFDEKGGALAKSKKKPPA